MNDLQIGMMAAEAGAEVIRRNFDGDITAEWKGDVDPVTAVDRAAEEAILAVVRKHRPDDRILAEESGGHDWDQGRVWIVDPLDGTVNFLHGLPQVSTSVGLRDDGRGVIGVVVDAVSREVFAAEAGSGATLNGQSIRVSDTAEPMRALIATGFPYDRQGRAEELAHTLAQVLMKFQGIRRLGSAALDLCWVAAGRLDAYYEDGVKPWDTAAGVLIVEEAGGRVSKWNNGQYPLDSPRIAATNSHIHAKLLEAINR